MLFVRLLQARLGVESFGLAIYRRCPSKAQRDRVPRAPHAEPEPVTPTCVAENAQHVPSPAGVPHLRRGLPLLHVTGSACIHSERRVRDMLLWKLLNFRLLLKYILYFNTLGPRGDSLILHRT